MHPRTVEVPNGTTITATKVTAPPAWALMERQLFSLMEESARTYTSKYAERGGATLLAEDLDDLYEQFYNFGLFYALGGADDMLDLHLQQWNATNRISDQSFNHRPIHNNHTKKFTPAQHNEFWGMNHPMEWHHLGEGLMAWYDMGVADPTISENARRSRRFAAMYIGEDPEADLWDASKRIIRSPFQSSQGPVLEGDVHWANTMRLAGRYLGGEVNYYGARSTLYPVVADLEADWWREPRRRKEIVGLFDRIVLNADSPNNLGATALITNAYLHTGDSRYKDWVIDYVGVWMERIGANGGVIPDNVGPAGLIGEHRDGCWWGGVYGWNSYCGFNILFHSLTIAAECALLLTGDYGYLDLLRSQIRVLIDNGITREDGQFLQAVRHGPEGWGHKMWNPVTGLDQPVRMNELAHLWHASLSRQDHELLTWVRERDVTIDWSANEVEGPDFYKGVHEYPRFQYYDGKNPGWPEAILRAELESVLKVCREQSEDDRTVERIIEDNRLPPNPVHTKVLTNVMMGAPQPVYHGGLLRATVRYFDPENARPGIPRDVAALVDWLEAGLVGLQLVNLDPVNGRRVVVQAGAFGEHDFTEVRIDAGESTQVTRVDGRDFAVELRPASAIRLEAGMRRFVNAPSHAFPWHGDRIPVPFQ